MFRGLTDLIEPLRQLLPPEVLAVIALLIAVAAAPAWWRSVRVRQIKGHLRRAARARDEAEREAELAGAFRRARGRPRLLVDLAENASRSGLPSAWRRAVEALEASGSLPLEARRLRREAEPPARALRDVDEAALRAERLLDLELWAAARETLDEAARRFPDSPEIRALAERLTREAPAPGLEEHA